MTFIAEVVGKHKSTISREIARNTGDRGYRGSGKERRGKIPNQLSIAESVQPVLSCVTSLARNGKAT